MEYRFEKTLRDEFAMRALTGLIAESPPVGHSVFMWPISGGASVAATVEERFAIAAYGSLPRDQLTQALAAATLTAHLAGRLDVKETT